MVLVVYLTVIILMNNRIAKAIALTGRKIVNVKPNKGEYNV